jgi:hypothetical protein
MTTPSFESLTAFVSAAVVTEETKPKRKRRIEQDVEENPS